MMKKITTGIVAHVDAGKTTLSEALLYRAGNIRNLGRVDNGDAFLDTQQLEKKRGITIFSHEAKLTTDDAEITLLDTPGHVDFAFQTEEVLSVLDYAILVISATDGVTSYAKTLWNLLEKNHVPVFIFVNKIDIAGANKGQVLTDIQKSLSENCLDFSQEDQTFYENVASADDQLLEKYLNGEEIMNSDIQNLIVQRKIYPVYFGSALKLTGITEFLAGFDKWTKEKEYSPDFSARCFKISHDKNGERLSWIKILGGKLQAKTELAGEKINQLREYNGEKFTTEVSPAYNEEAGSYLMGIYSTPLKEAEGLSVFQDAWYEICYSVKNTYKSLGMLITGKLNRQDVAGPVGIAVNVVGKTYETAKNYGVESVLYSMLNIVLLLSVNLGILNLLPIPALDGGRLVFLIIEVFRGKPVPPEKEGIVHFVGLVFFMILMVVVLFNDLVNIFG